MYFKRDANTKLYYEVVGDGQPVILLHGFGGNHVIWTKQVDWLVKNGYQAVTIDQRGHGASSDNSANEIKTLIDDTAIFIKHLNIKHPIIIGHSMGSSIVWGLMKFYPEIAPKKIVTVDQSPYMLNTDDWNFGLLDLTAINVIDRINNPKHVKETLDGLDDAVWKKLAPFKKKYPFNRKKNLDLLYDHTMQDWRGLVQKLKIPYLMIVAKKSPYFKEGYEIALAKQNKNITVAYVTDTGHDVMAEQPEEFNELLSDFLKG